MILPGTVSVVIPVYNAGSELIEAIDSVSRQTQPVHEIIVIDDGSTRSETRKILNALPDTVRILRQPNAGPASARNLGIRAASGHWIAFLDQDDLWKPEKLELQLQAAQQKNAQVVYTNAANFGTQPRVHELRLSPDQMPEGDVFVPLLIDNFLTMSGVMVERTSLDRIGLFAEELAGADDWDMWLRLSDSGCQFAAVTEPVTLYRWHDASLSKRHHHMHSVRMAVIRRALHQCSRTSMSVLTRSRALAATLRTSAWFIEQDDPWTACRWYLQSLSYWPLNQTTWRGLVKSLLAIRP